MMILLNKIRCFCYSSRLLANISAVSPNKSSSLVLSETSGKVLRLSAFPADSFSSSLLLSSLGGFDKDGTTWSSVEVASNYERKAKEERK